MKSFDCEYKALRCEVIWQLQNPMPRGLKSLIFNFCQVAHGFLLTADGRNVLKGKHSTQLCVALSLCGETRMRTINRNHRQKDKKTDVLSFPQFTDWDLPAGMEELLLGDIVICHNVCASQAKGHGISYEDEFSHLLVHGFLHLLDYDHERSGKEEKLMFSLEEKLVKKIGELK